MEPEFTRLGYMIGRKAIENTDLEETLKVFASVLAHGDHDLEGMPVEELILHREKQDHSLVYNASLLVGSSIPAYNLISRSAILPIAQNGRDPTEASLQSSIGTRRRSGIPCWGTLSGTQRRSSPKSSISSYLWWWDTSGRFVSFWQARACRRQK